MLADYNDFSVIMHEISFPISFWFLRSSSIFL